MFIDLAYWFCFGRLFHHLITLYKTFLLVQNIKNSQLHHNAFNFSLNWLHKAQSDCVLYLQMVGRSEEDTCDQVGVSLQRV